MWICNDECNGHIFLQLAVPGILKRGGQQHRVKRSKQGGCCMGQSPPALEFFFICPEIMGFEIKISTKDTIYGKL